MARAIVIICLHDRLKSIFAIQSFATPQRGEAYFARLQRNGRFDAHSGPSRGRPPTRAIRPFETIAIF
jgi:hypothetical protein